jgi:hypothetical protein
MGVRTSRVAPRGHGWPPTFASRQAPRRVGVHHRSLDPGPRAPIVRRMEHPEDQEHFGESGLGDAQSSNPPDDPDMIEPDADPLDTDVEDADLFLGDDDDDPDAGTDEP